MSEEIVRKSFQKVKEDVEGVKDELAFAIRRIAQIEAALNREAFSKLIKDKKK